MTIDKARSELISGNPYTNKFAEALVVAIDTMRKYQKIEQIVGNYGFDTSWLCLKKIREVLEDGQNTIKD